MARSKKTVVACDLCGYEQIEQVKDDLEVLGLRITRAFYAGSTGGGPVPAGLFVCDSCLNGTDLHGPALLSVLTRLVFHNEQFGPLEDSVVYAPIRKEDR